MTISAKRDRAVLNPIDLVRLITALELDRNSIVERLAGRACWLRDVR